MVHFHVIVLHGTKPRTVAKVSTLKKARAIAKSLFYEHLFDVVMIWRHESKFVAQVRRDSVPTPSCSLEFVESEDALPF